MPPREVAVLVMKIAQAVSYAHQHAVVHRDLKPANVLLDEDGEPHIADFGLAKRLSRESNLTATGQILGTPAFMAPEQAAGRDRAVNESVDIYSIGAILYAALTGRAPFEAATEIDVLLRVLDSDPKPPGKVVRGLPKQLDQICLHCLEKNPTRRYSSAASIGQDLQNYLKGEPLQMKTGGFLQSVRRWARREPALFVHTAAILGFLTVLQISHYTTDSPIAYHMKHVTTMLVWLCLSFVLQRAMNHPALEQVARFAWATIDVALLTLILCMAEPPRGLLLIGYPALVAASGMFVRVRLVVFTTIATVIGFLTFAFVQPLEVEKSHFAVFYVLGVVVIGCLVSAQVRRIRALSRYYEVESR
jgi:serine/threonine-protein kinase